MNPNGTLIVQADLTVFLDEKHPMAAEAREQLLAFAEASKRAGTVHTYRITPMSLWHALGAGFSGEQIISYLKKDARYGMPLQAEAEIHLWSGRYGKLRLEAEGASLVLNGDPSTLQTLSQKEIIREWVESFRSESEWIIRPEYRGTLKQELVRLGYPVLDHAGYHAGESLKVALRKQTRSGSAFSLRDYQIQAVEQFTKDESAQGGSGVVVLPCGTGKTIVGTAALASIGAATLILTSSRTSAQQWRDELLDKTTLTEAEVGLYSGRAKEVKPVTIATYQLLTHRKSKLDDFKHMSLFNERDWGLIIYDEVHLLPAPVFRMTASIQATRRLGLTATLVREDGCAEDVYSLIGPKQYDMHWKKAEEGDYIASVSCTEIRVPLPAAKEHSYSTASARAKLRIAAENPNKLPVVIQLLQKHKGKPALVIGQYLKQLKGIARELNAPLLTGETAHVERLRLYDAFRSGVHPVLVVSKVANLAVDLPDAAVAVQVSGSFGSRQEEAQRVGRLLRPKQDVNEAWFYTLVTDGTKETEFALKRQMFLLEQGYNYSMISSPASEDERDESVAAKEAANG